jgi:uncharacterized protein
MTNRLAYAHSPYLLQHREHPVDWYPWGDEAFELARDQDRPIFLSIGYSSCHWCHVMSQETFESTSIAALLNKHFVSVKVDREERPDIDTVYMLALQLMVGNGGWPASLFLTPDLHPFYAGTYFPPHRRGIEPGFDEIVLAVADAWRNRRGDAARYGREVIEAVQRQANNPAVGFRHSSFQPAVDLSTTTNQLDNHDVPAACLIDQAVERLHTDLDTTWGGFGSPPKFPQTSSLELLLRYGCRVGNGQHWEAVRLSMLGMCRGGLYDVLGGGFARYSVDRQWLVPHFEKMLYDNALLASLYLDAFRLGEDAVFADVARETLHYILNDLRVDGGGLASSEDADSRDEHGTKEEGIYYVWSIAEIIEALGTDRAAPFCAYYGVTKQGDFEGASILSAVRSIASVAEQFGLTPDQLTANLSEDRAQLRARRTQRERPARDDKILTSWNALAISALAVGGIVLEEPQFSEAAEDLAEFLWTKLRSDDGTLQHVCYQGTINHSAFLDDYAYLIDALVTMYETTGKARWIGRATRLADQMLDRFEDKQAGGFFYTGLAPKHSEVAAGPNVARIKDWFDTSTPASSAVAAMALTRLGRVALRDDFLNAAEMTLKAAGALMKRQPNACSKLIAALDYWHFGGKQWIFAARNETEIRPWTHQYFAQFRPHQSVAWVIGESPEKGPLAALLREKSPSETGVSLYLCQGHTCEPPIHTQEELMRVVRKGE